MEDNTLFITRQLTEYRHWPTGDNGCLFYVPDAPLGSERAQGAVYLINSPWREGDEVGKHDTLHQSEINSLPNLMPVAKGFSAFLLTQKSEKWMADRSVLDKWWNQYYAFCQDKRPRSGFETEYILQECLNWTLRNDDVITCFLCTHDLQYNLKDACHWLWTGTGMRVTGPNGKYIFLPAKGILFTTGLAEKGTEGHYCSSYGFNGLKFDSSGPEPCLYVEGCGLSIRLVYIP